jgi:hypothetical protein
MATGTSTLHQDETFVVETLNADDIAVSDDMTVGDDLGVTGDLLVGGTAQISGSLIVGTQTPMFTATIGLAKSSTTDGMDITITLKQSSGSTLGAIQTFIVFMSETNTGTGLTADTYSGDLTATTGTILQALTAKKAWLVTTAVSGIFAGTLVASANPTDQYVVVVHPLSGQHIVSAASGTNWEGAS